MLAVRRTFAVTLKQPLATSVVVHSGDIQDSGEGFFPIKREADRLKKFDNKVEYVTTKLDDIKNYISANSLWPMTFG
jgi:hypothetical protein